MTPSASYSDEMHPSPGSLRSILRLAWQALMLQEHVYPPLLKADRPFRRGLSILATILLVAALATSLGLLFDFLTLPRVSLFEERLYTLVTGIELYQDWAASSPYLAALAEILYKLIWFFTRISLGYPSRFDVIYSFFSTLIFGIFDWITYVIITQILARWMGSTTKKGAFYSTMALAYSPKLLLVANMVPGLILPPALVRFWILATSFQAIRITFKLPWGSSVALVILPYIVTTTLFILSLLLGIALGMAIYQILY